MQSYLYGSGYKIVRSKLPQSSLVKSLKINVLINFIFSYSINVPSRKYNCRQPLKPHIYLQKHSELDEQQKSTIRPTPTTTSTSTSTSTIRPVNVDSRRIQEFDRYEERIQSPVSISSGVINIKQEIKPETSIGVDNLVASYVDSTTYLHSPSNVQHSPMEIQNSVLVSQNSLNEELSPDDMTSSSGHRMMDPLNMNLSGMGMVNPNAVSRRHPGSSSSSEDLPCELRSSNWTMLVL